MTILDLAVLALIGAGAVLAMRSIRRDRKKGGCTECTGCCAGCPSRQPDREEEQS